MALTGIEIYKHLPKTNCKKCGQPTCLAFAMKLAQKGIELAACPDISEEAKQALDAASRPPIRLVTLGTGDKKFQVGNEVVMFRHEKTFYNPPGLMVRIKDTEAPEVIGQTVNAVANYGVERVGMQLALNGFAVENASKDQAAFVRSVELAGKRTDLPLVLMSDDPKALDAALSKVADNSPLIYAATKENADEMAKLAAKYKCPLAVRSTDGLDSLAETVDQVLKAGVEDIVLDPGSRDFAQSLMYQTALRRLALKKNFRLLGYPVITFPGEAAQSVEEEAILAGEQIAKYASIIVLDHFSPSIAYPLLTLRQNVYTDPQKPIQVTPGLYQIGSPKENSPLLVTTNFSLTYFSVAGETESSGVSSWLLVADTEGLSVLTAWAAGKFDSEKIAKSVKSADLSTLAHKKLIIPGAVATLSGELEDELSGWKVMVGPRDAVDIGGFLKRSWSN